MTEKNDDKTGEFPPIPAAVEAAELDEETRTVQHAEQAGILSNPMAKGRLKANILHGGQDEISKLNERLTTKRDTIESLRKELESLKEDSGVAAIIAERDRLKALLAKHEITLKNLRKDMQELRSLASILEEEVSKRDLIMQVATNKLHVQMMVLDSKMRYVVRNEKSMQSKIYDEKKLRQIAQLKDWHDLVTVYDSRGRPLPDSEWPAFKAIATKKDVEHDVIFVNGQAQDVSAYPMHIGSGEYWVLVLIRDIGPEGGIDG